MVTWIEFSKARILIRRHLPGTKTSDVTAGFVKELISGSLTPCSSSDRPESSNKNTIGDHNPSAAFRDKLVVAIAVGDHKRKHYFFQ
jgi:hypothetical protein